ncbi:hypothetical protein PINS_up001826 [Pythium insidiosum]|nr:hypothetical protein PINS_up001826 [Pythium insidiosum]
MGELTPVAPAMPSGAKPRTTSATATSASKVAPTSPFGITLEELRELNHDQMTEANLAELTRLGGVAGLARLLCVDLDHGLPQSEIENGLAVRKERFRAQRVCRRADEEPAAAVLRESAGHDARDPDRRGHRVARHGLHGAPVDRGGARASRSSRASSSWRS